MTSREIAELTGKEHKNVLSDIRSMLADLGHSSGRSAEFSADLGHSSGRPAEFSAQYKDIAGRSQPMFVLPKDLTLTLVSGYDVAMRHRIVTRWIELEGKAGPKASREAGAVIDIRQGGTQITLSTSGLTGADLCAILAQVLGAHLARA